MLTGYSFQTLCIVVIMRRPGPHHMCLLQVTSVRSHDVHALQRDKKLRVAQKLQYSRAKLPQERYGRLQCSRARYLP